MTHQRHYRRARSVADALDEIRAGAGSQFDPELAELFIGAFEGGEAEPEADGGAPLRLPMDAI